MNLKIMLNAKWKILIILIIIFSSTLVLRYDNILIRPLGSHNEDATAHVLVTLMGYSESDVLIHKFLPIFTLGGGANKYINDLFSASRVDIYGNYYYTSFPPLGFIAPFIFIKIFSLPISVLSIRLFSLILNFISYILVFYLSLIIFSKIRCRKDGINSIYLAFIASTIYLFNSESLWSHANAYWAHSLLQPLWIILLIIFFNIILLDPCINKNYINPAGITNFKNGHLQNSPYIYTSILLLGLINFLICYTEWTGYIISMTIVISSTYFYYISHSKKYIVLAIVIALTTLFSFLLTITLFSSTIGFNNYINSILFRASVRLGDIGLVQDLCKTYLMGYGPYILLLIILLIGLINLRYKCLNSNKFNLCNLNPIMWVSVLVLWFPLIENVIFLNHAPYYTFDTLKFSVPLAITISYLILLINMNKTKSSINYAIVILFIITTVSSAGLYLYANNPNIINDIRIQQYQTIGTMINQTSSQENLLFCNMPVRGHLIFYSHRNIIETSPAISIDEIRTKLNNTSLNNAMIYIMGGDFYNIPSVEILLPWIFYGNISGIIEVRKDCSHPTMIKIFPADYSDINWDKGILKYGMCILIHNKDVLKFLYVNDTLANQNGELFTISRLDGPNIWFYEGRKENLTKSIYFTKISTKCN